MKRTLIGALASYFFAISAFAAPSNEELKIGTSQEFDTLNPIISTTLVSAYIFGAVGRNLTMIDTKGKWVPKLAKSIPTIENGGAKIVQANGTKKIEAKWEILENAKWGDGTPVTCADFAFAREVAISPNVSVQEKEAFAQIEKIEWSDTSPKKCVFTSAKLKWDFNRLGKFYPLPKHLEEPIFKKFGSTKEGYEKNSNYVKNPTEPGLYNGPYKITKLVLGDYIALEPNPYFYGAKPKLKKIVVKIIPNTGTMEANLRSGTIDMIASLGVSLDQAMAIEKKLKAETTPFAVAYVPSITYEHIDLDLENEILKDLAVRKALLFSINRSELVKSLFEGKQMVADHSFSPTDPWYTKDPKIVSSYPYSLKEAAKLLDGAGWKIGSDGFRYKGDKKLSLTFMTTAGNKTRELVQSFLQEQWKQAGIEVTIKNEPAKVFFGETLRKRAFGGLAMYAWTSAPETNPRPSLHSASIPNSGNGWSGSNTPGWKNKTVDQAIESLDLELDPKKRKKLAWEIQKQYTSEVPVLPLYYRVDVSVVPKALKNYRMAGHLFSETNEIENWSM